MAILLLLTLLAGCWPLLSYGYLTSIGKGWDPEAYWPMAQHLTDYAVAAIPQAPPSPLRDLVTSPPQIGLTLTFSIVQGMTMLASGQSVIATFAPLLALLRALGVLAVFLWLRASMGLRGPAALAAAGLTSAGSLLLWVSFFNFGMQLAAWPLLALGLLLLRATLDDVARRGAQAWRSALLGALCIAAIPIAYYPALTIWLPLACAVGAGWLLDQLSPPAATRDAAPPDATRLRRALLAPLALLALAALLAGPAIPDYFEGFSFRYSLDAQKIGPDRFISLTDTLGLTAFRLVSGGAQPAAWLVSAAIAGIALGAAGLLLRPQGERERLRWLLLLGALAAYLLWLRYGRPYEYAYMKGSAYAGFALWGALAYGAQRLGELRPGARWLSLLLLAPALLAAVWSQALIAGEHAAAPFYYGRDLIDVAQAPIGDGAVWISNDPSLTGPNAAALAAIFYGHELQGRFATGYTSYARQRPGVAPRYAVLAAGERAWPLDVGGAELWRSRQIALFALPQDTALLDGRAALYDGLPPGDTKRPASLAIWRQAGPYAAFTAAAPLALRADGSVQLGAGPLTAAGPRRLTLTLAAMKPQRVAVSGAPGAASYALPAGLTQLSFDLPGAALITLTPERELTLVLAASAPMPIAPMPAAVAPQRQLDGIAWSANVRADGDAVLTTIRSANPGRRALRAELSVVQDSFEAAARPLVALAALPPDGELTIAYAPARAAVEARLGGTAMPLLALDARTAPPGEYFGVLTLYDGETPVQRATLFTLRLGDARLQLGPLPLGTTPLPLGPASIAPGIAVPLLANAALGDAATIEAALLLRPPRAAAPPAPDASLRPGDELGVALFWAAGGSPAPLMVSAQIVDAQDRKWAQFDGPAGGAWRPSQRWTAGERVRQDIPLTIDKAAPAGSYRLLIIVYDPASGQRLPILGQALYSRELTIEP